MKQFLSRIMVFIIVVAMIIPTCTFGTVLALDTSTETFKYLSNLNWETSTQADGTYPIKDKSTTKTSDETQRNPINIYGKEYTKGLGTHAGHEIIYNLNGMYTKFTAIVAPDNACNTSTEMSVMGLTILADNKEIFDNQHISFHDKDKINLDLNLVGAKKLKLIITRGDNGNSPTLFSKNIKI